MNATEKFVATAEGPRLLVIDNYDSFTENLVDLLRQLGAICSVTLNDALTLAELLACNADAFVVSPGPCTPAESGVSLPLFEAALARAERRPILGVCLGHQALAQAAGAKVVRAKPVHGKTSPIRHDGTGLFEGVPQGFRAARYNSLVVDAATLPSDLLVTAHADDDGHVMALAHRTLPLWSVQFHPESHLSEQGSALISAFLRLCVSRLR